MKKTWIAVTLLAEVISGYSEGGLPAGSIFGAGSTIESFSIGANSVPEPGSMVLGLLGGAAWLFRRRLISSPVYR